MPIKKSAFKALKKSKKRQQRNQLLKKTLKYEEKKIKTLIANQDLEKLKTEIKSFISRLDKSVVKGIIHKNKATRKKSRIMKTINRLAKQKTEESINK